MKYIAVLDTDEIEDFAFFEDGKEKYLHGIDANSVNGEWIYLPFKPLEQESILDKIRAEIKALSPEPTAYDVVDGNPVKDAVWEILIEVDKVLDKYKAESEET